MIRFGPWEIPEDEFVPEAGRYERAKFLPNKRILWYNAEEERAQIAGQKGGVYSVSLENCTCLDFCARELPCKHMIWLALKLGHRFEAVPEFDPVAAAKYKAEDIISLLETHWRKGELSYDAFQKCVAGLHSSVSLAENLCHKKGKSNTMDEAQITLNSFSSPGPTVNSNDIALGDTIGCCSYYHECSAAKRCLIPERDYVRDCFYRKNLKDGHIFYGKNANTFDMERYQHFVDCYLELSSSEADILYGVLHYFFIKKRLAPFGMFKIREEDVPKYTHLENGGYFRLVSNPKKVIENCTKKAMVTACGKRIHEANQWAKSQATPEKWSSRKAISKNDRPDQASENEYKGIKIYKEELTNWIVTFGPEILRDLSKDIYFIELSLETRLELEEFFVDKMYREGHIVTLDTGEDDPRFLVQK